MNLKTKIDAKFGSLKEFCRVSERDYSRTQYAIANGKNPLVLAEINKDVEALKPQKKKSEIPDETLYMLRARIIRRYGSFDGFCESHKFNPSFVSELINGKKTKLSKRVREVFEAAGVEV